MKNTKISSALKAAHANPSQKAKYSAAMRRRWDNPAEVAKFVKPHSEETRRKIGLARRTAFARGGAEGLEAFRQSSRRGHRTAQAINRHRLAALKMWSDPAFEDKQWPHKRCGNVGIFHSAKSGLDVWFGSSYELRSCRALESDISVIRFSRPSFTVPYFIEEEKHSYRPDFIAFMRDGTVAVIEVKAIWQLFHHERKLIIMRKLRALKSYCELRKYHAELWLGESLEKHSISAMRLS